MNALCTNRPLYAQAARLAPTSACLPPSSFTALPCVQRPALWKRVAASPRLSADDQDTGHAVHCWQVNTHFPLAHPPHQYTLSSLWQVNSGVKREKKALSVIESVASRPASDLHGRHRSWKKVSIAPARCIVSAFLASLHTFFIFMVVQIDLVASGCIVAGNHSDVCSLKLPPLEPL